MMACARGGSCHSQAMYGRPGTLKLAAQRRASRWPSLDACMSADVRQDGSDIGLRKSCLEIEASLASEPCYSMRQKLSRILNSSFDKKQCMHIVPDAMQQPEVLKSWLAEDHLYRRNQCVCVCLVAALRVM